MTEEQPATPPAVAPEQLRAAVDQLNKALRAWVEAITPAVRAAARAVEAARAANPDDYALAPPSPRPRDRPAWQSPHGPARPVHRR
ncbi:hypothetical protein [Streptomyces sioyaensis]|uniref:hypothetical protein n=1 Tax=Streptomyces sioyaensis TaxID=67364 RepID=UPI0036F0F222